MAPGKKPTEQDFDPLDYLTPEEQAAISGLPLPSSLRDDGAIADFLDFALNPRGSISIAQTALQRAHEFARERQKATAGRSANATKHNKKLHARLIADEPKIRAMIKRREFDEDGRRRSDRELEKLVREQGFRISRRKVAKLRRS